MDVICIHVRPFWCDSPVLPFTRPKWCDAPVLPFTRPKWCDSPVLPFTRPKWCDSPVFPFSRPKWYDSPVFPFTRQKWCDSPVLPFTRPKWCGQHHRGLLESSWEDLSLRQRRERDMSTERELPQGAAGAVRLQQYLELYPSHEPSSPAPHLLSSSRWVSCTRWQDASRNWKQHAELLFLQYQ